MAVLLRCLSSTPTQSLAPRQNRVPARRPNRSVHARTRYAASTRNRRRWRRRRSPELRRLVSTSIPNDVPAPDAVPVLDAAWLAAENPRSRLTTASCAPSWDSIQLLARTEVVRSSSSLPEQREVHLGMQRGHSWSQWPTRMGVCHRKRTYVVGCATQWKIAERKKKRART